jgi:hypothetical protein
MLTAIALAAVLGGAPAQPGDLKLTNVRLTVGELGPPRESARLLPGDVLFIAYDIDGLTIDREGLARYTMAMEVTNPTGRVILEQKPREMVDDVPLRGNRMPARAFITVGLDDAPGVYGCKLTVTDTNAQAKPSTTLNIKFEVLKKDFGVVAVYTSHDPEGKLSAPTNGQVGQTLYVHFSVASFERDPKTKQPNVELEFQFFDDKGAALLLDAKGMSAPRKHIQDDKSALPVKETDGAFALQFPLFLNRPGKFVAQIKATDRVTKKEFTYKLPITINPAQ